MAKGLRNKQRKRNRVVQRQKLMALHSKRQDMLAQLDQESLAAQQAAADAQPAEMETEVEKPEEDEQQQAKVVVMPRLSKLKRLKRKEQKKKKNRW